MRRPSSARYNMYEAKTLLSEVVARALEGQEVILMNRGKPVAKVVPFISGKPPRKLGFAKDIRMLEDFNAIPEGFEDYA